jgi:hypothetical protein
MLTLVFVLEKSSCLHCAMKCFVCNNSPRRGSVSVVVARDEAHARILIAAEVAKGSARRKHKRTMRLREVSVSKPLVMVIRPWLPDAMPETKDY